ncbi:MAG: alkaline phosphatase [Pantoea agglomerans]|nr:alkaline phosphatase [Pantoea agglomerans]
MLQETRLHRIRALLTRLNQVSTERIIRELGVSRETARRDIIELEALGLARRVHGGLVAIETRAEPPLTERRSTQTREKRAIARAAAQLLQPGQTLFLDALHALSGLTIVTNSLQAALALSAGEEDQPLNNQIILLGGMMSAGAQQTRGEITVGEIIRYRADVALLSPVGIEAGCGASSFHPHEAAIARAMVQQSTSCYLLADHTKLGVVSRTVYAPSPAINLLITDSGGDNSAALEALQQTLPEVMVV